MHASSAACLCQAGKYTCDSELTLKGTAAVFLLQRTSDSLLANRLQLRSSVQLLTAAFATYQLCTHA